MFDSILNPIFSPLFSLKPIYAITIISLGITLLITLIYKYTTDQELMKSLKKGLKDSQNEMKKHKDNPQKVMELQKQAMGKNMEYMKHSMKSTLFTMIPIIIIFGFLNSHLGYYPITPDTPFTTQAIFKEGTTGEIELSADNLQILNGAVQTIENNVATFELQGQPGEYVLEYTYLDKPYTQELLITNERTYKRPIIAVKGSDLKQLLIRNEKVIALNLFGWKLGWLGTYILLSIAFSTLIRKLLKIH